jgi:hypothetical protein
MFYKAVIQLVLFYGSKTWVLSRMALARLEGFHIRVAYKMAKRHVPCRGPNWQWIYPKSEDVLNKCSMSMIEHYLNKQRQTIATYVVERSIFRNCMELEWRQGSVPRQWWWEQ